MMPRILIVEDEIVVALFMEDILGEFGYEVAGVVSHVDDAMARPATMIWRCWTCISTAATCSISPTS